MNRSLKKARNNRFMSSLLIGFGVFVGVLFFVLFSIGKQKYETAMSWPTADGRVTESVIKEQTKVNKVGRKTVYTTEYVHHWKVAYEVADQPFNKDYKHRYDSQSIAQRELRKWHPGASVVMHYNPSDFADTHREGINPISPWAGLFFGGIMVLIAWGMRSHFSSKIKTIESQLARNDALRTSKTGPELQVFKQAHQMPAVNATAGNSGIELDSAKYLRSRC